VASVPVEVGERWVLPVGLESRTRGLVRQALAPIRVVENDDDAARTLDLAARVRVDGLVVGFPLAGVAIEEFLDAVRRLDSPCRRAGVVLIAPERFRGHAEDHISRGANRFVALEELEHGLRPAVERVVGVARRLATSVPVRVEVLATGFARRVFCQTVNLSASGMLLRAQHSYPAGTALRFELLLPGSVAPVRGSAHVVRAAVQRREPYPGLGVSFAGFDHGGAARLAEFLHRPGR